ncbi:uncharacterized protein PFL1_06904 [Pseudozyma flocculosa PF-1]|uniref:GDT1 family protein n=2 Tax=Pseudozyma flocculosa TaxID=84751 RepID=A0A5C3FBU3_9BASI|nr:uncharacterized protein PFL1_06904 [Pseudozyma flocculosa PF-1]EPQ26708.1 hypothetical protein PFL1_06904 [Pseudozyma flocculosa PF-1]SPO40971.1 uncharacterized protein PSFLO_06453 [Pseudozyma flocculosa]
MASPADAAMDPTLLMGGSESGSIPSGFTPLALGLVEAWNNDPRALWSSFAMIIVSEIGDKTFLIAAILSMRHPKNVVFAGAFASLAVMSVLSSALGVMFPSLLPKSWTTLLAALLFFAFGIKMVKEGLEMSGDEMEEEWNEAQREIEDEEGGEAYQMEQGGVDASSYPVVNPYPATNGAASASAAPPQRPRTSDQEEKHRKPSAWSAKEGAKNLCGLCFSPIFAQAFILTFLGEWGDRSQIATIALAAAHNVTLVCLGTVLGHACCTSLAVICGSWLASRISVRHVTLGGALLFLLFGVIYLYESFTLFGDIAASTAPDVAQSAVNVALAGADGAKGIVQNGGDKMANAVAAGAAALPGGDGKPPIVAAGGIGGFGV